eukprot:6769991-Heterocapsa_arctica.AAC.1
MGSPPPPNPGSHRALVQSSVDPSSIPPNCPQCPVHINKILELQAVSRPMLPLQKRIRTSCVAI